MLAFSNKLQVAKIIAAIIDGMKIAPTKLTQNKIPRIHDISFKSWLDRPLRENAIQRLKMDQNSENERFDCMIDTG